MSRRRTTGASGTDTGTRSRRTTCASWPRGCRSSAAPAPQCATPRPSCWTARRPPAAGQGSRRDRARHLRTRPLPDADPHRLRGQLQQQPLADQPLGSPHRLPPHLRRHPHRTQATAPAQPGPDLPASGRHRRPRPSRLHAGHPAGHGDRQARLQRGTRPRRPGGAVPRPPRAGTDVRHRGLPRHEQSEGRHDQDHGENDAGARLHPAGPVV
jgi:hypothetical protein